MIRIAIVEDEAAYVEQLKIFLTTYSKDSNELIEVTEFSDGDQIVSQYRAQFDIILMDIQMKFMDGMTAAEEIRKMDSQVVIIFLTNMAEYAIKGYAVDALDYVLKPVSYFAFSQRLDRAIARMKKRETQYLTIDIKGGTKRLEVSDIYYVESQGHTLIYNTAKGKFEAYGTMKEAEERLLPMYFARGNKGYIINLEHVDKIQDGCAIVKGESLLLSRSRKNIFMEALTNYWGEVVK